MTLDGAYHMGSMSGAVCSPSRTMVMSGRTLWHLPRRGKSTKSVKRASPRGKTYSTIPFPQSLTALQRHHAHLQKRKQLQCGQRIVHRPRGRHQAGRNPETGSEWHGDRVIHYLNGREKAKDPNPFFIYFGFSHPHASVTAPPNCSRNTVR